MQHLLDLFISINCSTCFMWFLCPFIRSTKLYIQRQAKEIYINTKTSKANCTKQMQQYGITQHVEILYVQSCAPGDGRRNHVKHVIYRNRLRKVASCWLYFKDILSMHGHMNVKYILYYSLHIYMNYDNEAHTCQYFNPSSFNQHFYITHKPCCYGLHMHQLCILMMILVFSCIFSLVLCSP
jgi:hypothetical protein